MVKKDLVRSIVAVLRDNDIRKQVSIPKRHFTISDDEGQTRTFSVKQTDKYVNYNIEDVEAILDACQHVICEAVKSGDVVNIFGFGKLILKYHKPIKIKRVTDGEDVAVPGFYKLKFIVGNDLLRCVQFFEHTLADRREEEQEEIINWVDDEEDA